MFFLYLKVSYKLKKAVESVASERLRKMNDWRLELLQKHYGEHVSSFSRWKRLQNGSDKTCAFTQRNIQAIPEMCKMTENLLLYVNEMRHIVIQNRKNGSKLTWPIDTFFGDPSSNNFSSPPSHNFRNIRILDWTVTYGYVTTHGMINFKFWDFGHPSPEPKLYSVKPGILPYCIKSYSVNKNFILLKYVSLKTWGRRQTSKTELWKMSDPTVQITLPNCNVYLNEYGFTQKDLGCKWMMDTNPKTQFLVAASCSQFIAPDSKKMLRKVVVIFNGFESPTFSHAFSKILPPDVRGYDRLHRGSFLSTVGNGDFTKTVFVLQSFGDGPPDWGLTEAQCYIFDVSTGELVLTFTRNKTSGTLTNVGRDCLAESGGSGINLNRINWDGQEWSISTNWLSFPNADVPRSSLLYCTDTQVMYPYVFDYLLCDYLFKN